MEGVGVDNIGGRGEGLHKMGGQRLFCQLWIRPRCF